MTIRVDATATATADVTFAPFRSPVDPARLAATLAPTLFPQAGVPTWQVLSPTSIRFVIEHVFVPGAQPGITINMAPAQAALVAMGIAAADVELFVPNLQTKVDWASAPNETDRGHWTWRYPATAAVGSISFTPQPWLGALGAALALTSPVALVVAGTTAFRRRRRSKTVAAWLTVTWMVLVAQLIEVAVTGATVTGNLAAAGVATAAQFHVLTVFTRVAFAIPLIAHVTVALASRRGRRSAPAEPAVAQVMPWMLFEEDGVGLADD